MKKIILICMATAMMCGTTMAQDKKQENRQAPDKQEMVKRHTEMMVQKYGLDENQKTKLLELNNQYSDMMRPMMRPPRRGEFGRPGMDRSGDNAKERPQMPPTMGENKERPQMPPAMGDRRFQRDSVNQGDRPHRPGMGRPGGFDPEKRKAYEEALSKIMTPEQYSQYQEDMKNRMQFRPQMPQNQQ